MDLRLLYWRCTQHLITCCVVALAWALWMPEAASGDLIVTSLATGTSNRASSTDFVGILDNNAPPQIGGLDVSFNNVPAGESFAVGDLVGRDMDASGGGRVWEYLLTLPADAMPGTGLTALSFIGHAFERSTNNLDGSDQVLWEMFLNNDATPVASGGPAVGSDWTTYDINLSDPGGDTITQVRVVFTVTGFDDVGDWFASRGTLSAIYSAIPEPHGLATVLAACGWLATALRRRR